MYVFARSIVLGSGGTRDAATWVGSITEKVNQVTDLNMTVWRTVFSPEIRKIAFVSAVEELSQLEAADDKLAADESFVALLDQGANFTVGSIDDALGQVIYSSTTEPVPMEYAATVSALISPGKFGRGVELGVQIAEQAAKITGQPITFVKGVTGDYSAIQWLTTYENIQSLQAAGDKLNADADFLKLLDKETPGVYEAGLSVTQQTVYRKVL
jgi:hypothetical protein